MTNIIQNYKIKSAKLVFYPTFYWLGLLHNTRVFPIIVLSYYDVTEMCVFSAIIAGSSIAEQVLNKNYLLHRNNNMSEINENEEAKTTPTRKRSQTTNEVAGMRSSYESGANAKDFPHFSLPNNSFFINRLYSNTLAGSAPTQLLNTADPFPYQTAPHFPVSRASVTFPPFRKPPALIPTKLAPLGLQNPNHGHHSKQIIDVFKQNEEKTSSVDFESSETRMRPPFRRRHTTEAETSIPSEMPRYSKQTRLPSDSSCDVIRNPGFQSVNASMYSQWHHSTKQNSKSELGGGAKSIEKSVFANTLLKSPYTFPPSKAYPFSAGKASFFNQDNVAQEKNKVLLSPKQDEKRSSAEISPTKDEASAANFWFDKDLQFRSFPWLFRQPSAILPEALAILQRSYPLMFFPSTNNVFRHQQNNLFPQTSSSVLNSMPHFTPQAGLRYTPNFSSSESQTHGGASNNANSLVPPVSRPRPISSSSLDSGCGGSESNSDWSGTDEDKNGEVRNYLFCQWCFDIFNITATHAIDVQTCFKVF